MKVLIVLDVKHSFFIHVYLNQVQCIYVDSVAVTLARPLHVSKVSQSKEKGKTKQVTHK